MFCVRKELLDMSDKSGLCWNSSLAGLLFCQGMRHNQTLALLWRKSIIIQVTRCKASLAPCALSCLLHKSITTQSFSICSCMARMNGTVTQCGTGEAHVLDCCEHPKQHRQCWSLSIISQRLSNATHAKLKNPQEPSTPQPV